MELNKYIIIIIFINLTNFLYADIIQPAKNLTAYDVVKIQLTALKNNNKQSKNDGIKQTWIFAHPENKKYTGPYERFEKMILGNQYKILLNHTSHKISLLTNTEDNYTYKIELMTKNKKIYFYEWQLEKSTTEKCQSCWFTTMVSPPVNIGDAI
ncbi:DUF4864 domain-containing protein [Pelagibacteraceae bacterium]|nr:DUF4864 domain-containing protein [Pelagibacteraceae bacterium]